MNGRIKNTPYLARPRFVNGSAISERVPKLGTARGRPCLFLQNAPFCHGKSLRFVPAACRGTEVLSRRIQRTASFRVL